MDKRTLELPGTFEHTYSEADIAEVGRLIEWLSETGNTRSALARAAGISAATVSMVLSGRLRSSPTRHLDAMSAARDRDRDRHDHPSEIPFTETSVSRAVAAVCRRAHRDRDFGLFAGRVGIGKTVALRRYAAEHPGAAVLLDAYPGATAPVVLRLLCQILGIHAARRSVADRTAALVEELRGSDRIILVDEAETLTDQALLHLRRISDAAGVGVVLVGTAGLLGLIYDPEGRFGQITSRVGFWPPLCQSIGRDDARALTAAYLGEEPSAALERSLWESCQGSARGLRNLLRNASRACRRKDVPLTAAAVAEVEATTVGGRRLAA